MDNRDPSAMELMVVTAAKEIRDREVVFAGTGLPMLAGMLAQRTHAPASVIVFEAGAVDPRMRELPMSVGDSRTLAGAAQASGLFEVFSYILQAGRVDVGFLGAAQIDRYGNLNSTAIGPEYARPEVHLPGSGGSADVAALSGRTVVLARHERRRLVERVDYCTAPGWLSGADSRDRAGITGGGPAAGLTSMGVIRFAAVTREPYLYSFHPDFSPAEVQAQTQFVLDVAAAVETPRPSAEEIRILREDIDPGQLLLKRTL